MMDCKIQELLFDWVLFDGSYYLMGKEKKITSPTRILYRENKILIIHILLYFLFSTLFSFILTNLSFMRIESKLHFV